TVSEQQVAPVELIAQAEDRVPGPVVVAPADVRFVRHVPLAVVGELNRPVGADNSIPEVDGLRGAAGRREYADRPGEVPVARNVKVRVAEAAHEVERARGVAYGGGARRHRPDGCSESRIDGGGDGELDFASRTLDPLDLRRQVGEIHVDQIGHDRPVALARLARQHRGELQVVKIAARLDLHLRVAEAGEVEG